VSIAMSSPIIFLYYPFHFCIKFSVHVAVTVYFQCFQGQKNQYIGKIQFDEKRNLWNNSMNDKRRRCDIWIDEV